MKYVKGGNQNEVEAYTASWIEIKSGNIYPVGKPVEAYTASWIEIQIPGLKVLSVWSKPIRLRGLKLLLSALDVH